MIAALVYDLVKITIVSFVILYYCSSFGAFSPNSTV